MPKDGADTSALILRRPDTRDGAKIWSLVRACRPLDENSMYCNLIQCTHFRDTCVLAERNGDVVGWISAHIPPNAPETLFVWQVAVAAEARGEGLGPKMLTALTDRAALRDIRRIETTITDDNAASWRMFEKFGARSGAATSRAVYFDKEKHFDGDHASEYLLRIDFAQSLDQAA